MNVIPAIDLRGGRCVRLLRGEFDQETEYHNDPAAIAALAQTYGSLGVEHLHLVDLDGARGDGQVNRGLVTTLTQAAPLRVQLGGGIREQSTLESWFDAGVDRCVIGSLAISDQSLVAGWLRSLGPERIVLALDVRIGDEGTPWITTHGWQKTSDTSLWDCIGDYVPVGLRHVLCTDVSRDGAMSGPNVDLYREIVRRFPDISLQASGGVRNRSDLEALRETGAVAAITGRALLDGSLTRTEVAAFQRDA
ncbi:MAG: 1-(5-phosphoribosyl)-5-[(5-phosphoribosylamino)methylideneamino] imidazole-4-carboxamide isomerase [Pseudomonadota bacterium]